MRSCSSGCSRPENRTEPQTGTKYWLAEIRVHKTGRGEMQRPQNASDCQLETFCEWHGARLL